MGTKSLQAADVCRILEASAKSGVSELEFGDLRVKFGRTVDIEEAPGPSPRQTTATKLPVTDLTDADHKKQASDSLWLDTVRMRDEQVARALVEDPVLYERLQRDEELGDALDGTDDSDDE